MHELQLCDRLVEDFAETWFVIVTSMLPDRRRVDNPSSAVHMCTPLLTKPLPLVGERFIGRNVECVTRLSSSISFKRIQSGKWMMGDIIL